MEKEQADRLKALLNKFGTAMLVTHAGGDKMRARPMAIAHVEDNCDLWFITARETAKVHEIENEQAVTIVCQDGGELCVSFSGVAQLVDDRRKVYEFWNSGFEPWFPRGKDDPEIRLIFVRGDEAEFWDKKGASGVKYLFEKARRLAGGEHVQEKQHGKVKLAVI